MISTEVCDAISKNHYTITSFSYLFTVGLSSRYNFLSFIDMLIFWRSVYNSSWSFMLLVFYVLLSEYGCLRFFLVH